MQKGLLVPARNMIYSEAEKDPFVRRGERE